jgi:hypothetical protein
MTIPRLAVYTTWYPGVERFLPEWSRSLVDQTDRNFALWVGVDGLEFRSVAEPLGGLSETHWVIAEPGDTPARVRERALVRIVQDYPAVVFVDSDDVLMPSRVAAARAALEKHDVAGCALKIVDEDGKDLGVRVRFGPPAGVEWAELLPRHNVFGLSNSAYRSDVLRRLLPLPETCILIDWLFATRAWALGYDMYFDEEPGMSYRQYGENVAKVIPPFTSTDVLRATERVRKHYDLLLDEPSWPMPASSLSLLMAARKRFTAFERFVLESPTGLASYVEALNALPPRFVWWWAIANPELEQIWMK